MLYVLNIFHFPNDILICAFDMLMNKESYSRNLQTEKSMLQNVKYKLRWKL